MQVISIPALQQGVEYEFRTDVPAAIGRVQPGVYLSLHDSSAGMSWLAGATMCCTTQGGSSANACFTQVSG
jgi:hypothetical protein